MELEINSVIVWLVSHFSITVAVTIVQVLATTNLVLKPFGI
jgi:hypothetical protein